MLYKPITCCNALFSLQVKDIQRCSRSSTLQTDSAYLNGYGGLGYGGPMGLGGGGSPTGAPTGHHFYLTDYLIAPPPPPLPMR